MILKAMHVAMLFFVSPFGIALIVGLPLITLLAWQVAVGMFNAEKENCLAKNVG